MIHNKKFTLLIFFFLVIQIISECFGRSSTSLQMQQIRTLKSGWYNWDPYQYLKNAGDQESLTGLDIELQKIILKKLGYNITITPVSWKQHQYDLKTGERDCALGAFYSKERAEYAHITIPYRYEENSVFVRRDSISNHSYSNVKEFLRAIKTNKLKIGVVDGYRYANDALNDFVDDYKNNAFIVKSLTDDENLALLLQGKIDAFLADRIVGATIIWRAKVGKQMSEIRLDSKAPIHMLLSKKTISMEEFSTINQAIADIKDSPEYVQTVSWYLYPVLLLETTDSQWFMIIEAIGIIAFALSGLVVGYKYQANLFGTFLLALLPSFGGGVLRDVIFGRYPIWFITAKFYFITVIFIILLCFFSIKFYHHIKIKMNLNFSLSSNAKSVAFFDNLLMVTDALGLAAFTVTGVVVSLIVKAEPLWLWGPFFAFLTGAAGGILRDCVVKEVKVESVQGHFFYPEIAIFWGAVLSLYLTYSINDIDPVNIKIAVMTTIACVFLSRIVLYLYKVPNIFMKITDAKDGEGA